VVDVVSLTLDENVVEVEDDGAAVEVVPSDVVVDSVVEVDVEVSATEVEVGVGVVSSSVDTASSSDVEGRLPGEVAANASSPRRVETEVVLVTVVTTDVSEVVSARGHDSAAEAISEVSVISEVVDGGSSDCAASVSLSAEEERSAWRSGAADVVEDEPSASSGRPDESGVSVADVADESGKTSGTIVVMDAESSSSGGADVSGAAVAPSASPLVSDCVTEVSAPAVACADGVSVAGSDTSAEKVSAAEVVPISDSGTSGVVEVTPSVSALSDAVGSAGNPSGVDASVCDSGASVVASTNTVSA
jgi:hypothetical protein